MAGWSVCPGFSGLMALRALPVHRPVQERLLGRRVARHLPSLVELGKTGRGQPARRIGRRERPSPRRTLILPLLPAVSPRSKRERPMPQSRRAGGSRRHARGWRDSRQPAPGFQEEVRRSEVPGFHRQRQRASALAGQRCGPWHAGIDFGADPQAFNAQRLDHGPGGLTPGDDQLPDPEPDQALRDGRPARSPPARPLARRRGRPALLSPLLAERSPGRRW